MPVGLSAYQIAACRTLGLTHERERPPGIVYHRLGTFLIPENDLALDEVIARCQRFARLLLKTTELHGAPPAGSSVDAILKHHCNLFRHAQDTDVLSFAEFSAALRRPESRPAPFTAAERSTQ